MHMVCRHGVDLARASWVGGMSWSKHSLTTLGYCGIPVMGLCASLGSITVYVAPMARLAAEQGHVGGFSFVAHMIHMIHHLAVGHQCPDH